MAAVDAGHGDEDDDSEQHVLDNLRELLASPPDLSEPPHDPRGRSEGSPEAGGDGPPALHPSEQLQEYLRARNGNSELLQWSLQQLNDSSRMQWGKHRHLSLVEIDAEMAVLNWKSPGSQESQIIDVTSDGWMKYSTVKIRGKDHRPFAKRPDAVMLLPDIGVKQHKLGPDHRPQLPSKSFKLIRMYRQMRFNVGATTSGLEPTSLGTCFECGTEDSGTVTCPLCLLPSHARCLLARGLEGLLGDAHGGQIPKVLWESMRDWGTVQASAPLRV